MQSNSFEIRPIAGALGAEIAGIDLSQELDEGMIAAIRRAWLYAPAGASIARSLGGRNLAARNRCHNGGEHLPEILDRAQ